MGDGDMDVLREAGTPTERSKFCYEGGGGRALLAIA
jgi:hypothetical protein